MARSARDVSAHRDGRIYQFQCPPWTGHDIFHQWQPSILDREVQTAVRDQPCPIRLTLKDIQ